MRSLYDFILEERRCKPMRKSIRKMVLIRVAAALASVLLFSVMMTVNIIRVDRTQEASAQANALLDRAQKAEATS